MLTGRQTRAGLVNWIGRSRVPIELWQLLRVPDRWSRSRQSAGLLPHVLGEILGSSAEAEQITPEWIMRAS
jgi:hypothetical protein